LTEFNLIDEPWIPCTMGDGGRELLGIREALARAPAVAEVRGDSPLVIAALHRLLLAILHRNFPVEDPGQWAALRARKGWDDAVLDGYLARWHHRFDLFDGERPFYQVSGLDLSRGGSSARLMFHQDNNPTLFSHLSTSAPPELTPAEAARLLVGFMAFDVGGIKTSERSQESARAAPLNKGAVVLPRGGNLFETLMLSMCRYVPEEGDPWDFDRERDLPAWERDGETRPEDRVPGGYIDLLTWQSRRIRLQPEPREDGRTVVKNVVIMKGYQPPEDFNLHGRETMLAFKRNPRARSDNDPWPEVTFTRDRALWRDSFTLMHSAGGDSQPPEVLNWLSELVAEDVLPRDAVLPVDAFGLNSSQSKVFFWRHERFPVPLRYLADRNLVDSLKTAIELTEETAQGLGGVVWTMAKNVLAPDQRDVDRNSVRTLVNHLGAEQAYWSRLEEPFQLFMQELVGDRNEHGEYGDRAIPAWKATLRTTLRDAFQEATLGMERSPRALRAVAIAERHVGAVIRRHLTDADQEGISGDATA
jgi:CRISPR system Cascade subunit CasA